jgi:hypothetical protein
MVLIKVDVVVSETITSDTRPVISGNGYWHVEVRKARFAIFPSISGSDHTPSRVA